MKRALALALLVAVPGCVTFGDTPAYPAGPIGPGPAPPEESPPLAFGGVVLDALSGRGVPDAGVVVNLGFVHPCRREGLTYTSWTVQVDPDGRFGPFEVPRPRSDDFAFFVHVNSPGYTENVTFIGPKQAASAPNLTLVLHPQASVEGTAPAGTLVALTVPGFPRVTAADEAGRFSFPGALVGPAQLLVATRVPAWTVVTPPASFDADEPGDSGWMLEGIVRGPSGAGLAADVVAWNGTRLWSAARASDTGVFALPLPKVAVDELRIEVRTQDGHYGGVKVMGLMGSPALRESIVANPLC